MRALLYLGACQIRNSLRRAPRNPRILLPTLAFGLFLIFLLQTLQSLSALHEGPADVLRPMLPPGAFVLGQPGKVIATLRAALLISFFTSAASALGEGTLVFSPSDIDFLCPAPLSPRAVLLFKMLGRYAGLTIPAIYLPLVFGGVLITALAGASPVALWPAMLGIWLFFVASANVAQTILITRTPASLPGSVPAGDTDIDPAARRRLLLRALCLAALVVLLLGLLWTLFHQGTFGETHRTRATLQAVLRAVNGRAATLLLFPIAWAADLLRVPLEGWTIAAFGRLLGLVLTAAASLGLLVARGRDFYETATEISERRVRMVSAVHRGDAGTILSQMAGDGILRPGRTIPAFGCGALAILWKDAIALTRTPPRAWGTLLLVAAFPAVLGLLVSGRRSDVSVIVWLVLFTLNMSSVFLLSLRDMLRRADVSRALPIAPARVLLGELGMSVAQLTVLGWFSLGAMAITGVVRPGPLFLIAFVTLPALSALLLFVQTIFVLLYPQKGPGGDAAQSAVAGLTSVVASAVSLIPGGAVAVVMVVFHARPLLLGVGVGATNLAAAAFALQIAAVLWRRFDPTA